MESVFLNIFISWSVHWVMVAWDGVRLGSYKVFLFIYFFPFLLPLITVFFLSTFLWNGSRVDNSTDKNPWNRVTSYLKGSKNTSSRSVIIIGPLRGFEPFSRTDSRKRPIQWKMRCIWNQARILNPYHDPGGIPSPKTTLGGMKTKSLNKKLDHRKVTRGFRL